jgi:hypothetical protein
MVRSFLTRLFGSVTQTVRLVPCLLVCLACATPFPIENLEEGMTTETVREKFGAPKAMEVAGGGGGISCWTYWHEEQYWKASLLFFHGLLAIPINALRPGVTWDASYLVRNSVFLRFEEDKLVSWRALDPVMEEYENPIFEPFFHDPFRQDDDWEPDYWWGPDYYEVQLEPSLSDPPTCHSPYEPPTPCKLERTTAEGRVEVGDTSYVARNYVSLRLEPTTSSNEERISVNCGQPLKILGKRGGWCHVEDNVGTIGWVGCVFLESKPH